MTLVFPDALHPLGGNCRPARGYLYPLLLHWHSSRLESSIKIQYGFLGEGAGGVFFGHKEYPSRNIFTYSEPRAMTLVRGMGLNKPHSVHP